MMIKKESLLKKYEQNQLSTAEINQIVELDESSKSFDETDNLEIEDIPNRFLDKIDEIVDELSVYIKHYDTEIYDKAIQIMLDNLSKEQFDKILEAINYKTIFDNSDKRDMVEAIYYTVSKSKKITFKQLKCFVTYLKLIKVDNKSFKQF